MNTKEAYNEWAEQYDTNVNRTRDLEAIALRQELSDIEFMDVLEVGCGTGKNTEWLLTCTEKLTGVDLSEEMLKRSKEKIKSPAASFVQADITEAWTFAKSEYDLVTFSLVLEHIENLDDIFAKAAGVLKPGGRLYMGELHPFKQYIGSKARFETAAGTKIVTCFTHHASEFYRAATASQLVLEKFNEYFDDGSAKSLPRIMTMVFRKL